MLIVTDIVSHAAVRKYEWIMAGMFIHLGYVLSLPFDTFGSANAFLVMKQYMSESSWALVFGVFGFTRLIVLILNGTHIRQSAQLRMILSGISFLILCLWVWGIDASDTASTGSATYKWLALGELMNVWQASADIRRKRGLGNGS